MATIQATMSLSSDISTYGVQIGNTMTMTKSGSTTGLDQATGLIRKTLSSINEVDLITVGAGVAADIPNNLFSSKVYIKNVNSDSSEYFTVGLGKASTGSSKEDFSVADSAERSVELGRLYANDWMLIPWDAVSDENDIFVKPSVATNMVVEYMVFYQLADS